jgi:hypothetical protein
MSDPTLPSFRYPLGQQPPRADCGDLARCASVRQFPVSQGIGGSCCSKVLKPKQWLGIDLFLRNA